MARDYGKIRHGFWTGETGRELRALGSDTMLVGAYLCTCGSSNMIGLYYIPMALIAHETPVPIEGVSKALRSLGEAGFAFYDDAAEVVFVPHMAREQIAEKLSEGDKQRQGVITLLKEYKKSRFVADFLAIYKECYHLPDGLEPVPPSKGERRPLPDPSKPEIRDQDQEQEFPPSRDPGTTGTKPKTAHDWLSYFGVKYWEIRKRQYGRGTGDAKAMGNFGELLDSLPPEQRAADWLDRERIVTEFLNRSDARTVSAGWPFCFFATDFRGLALPPDKRPKPEPRQSFQRPGQPAPYTWPDLPGAPK